MKLTREEFAALLAEAKQVRISADGWLVLRLDEGAEEVAGNGGINEEAEPGAGSMDLEQRLGWALEVLRENPVEWVIAAILLAMALGHVTATFF